MYVPLPKFLKIGDSKYLSDITGLDEQGLFTKEDIKSDTWLGITHFKDDRLENGYSRTPLGGFFNHNSKDPNCKVIVIGDTRQIITIKDIKAGEELTAEYTFYDPEK